MIDTHCHLNYAPLSEDVEGVIKRAHEAGVSFMMVPGTDLESSIKSIELARENAFLISGVGFHPESLDEYYPDALGKLEVLIASNSEVQFIGEVGLDYYHFEGFNGESDRIKRMIDQKKMFLDMLKLADQNGLPLVLHSRDAFDDMLNSLLDYNKKLINRSVLHCFVGDYEQAKLWLDLGGYISLTGIITYKKNIALREVVAELPLDRLMLETDAPFLPPEGFRNKVCEPMYIPLIAQVLAGVKGVGVDVIEKITDENAKKFFNI